MRRASALLIKYMQERGLTLALAESMTAGLACHRLAGVKGACDVLKGSLVCYHEDVKTGLLRVSPALLKRYTAESQQVTDALVKKLPGLIPADVSAAVTGLAAEGGSESAAKPVGTVFFSVYYRNRCFRKKRLYRGSPVNIRRKACDGLFRFILSVLMS